MIRVVVTDDFEESLKFFRRRVQESGLIREMRQRTAFQSQALRRRQKSLRARRRRQPRGR
jgi:ribosomal protein S21